MLKIKRVYEDPEESDGFRILVDRLWPRGLTKEKAKIDLWLKEIAPSNELRQWFHHDPSKWQEFQKRYAEELATRANLLKQLHEIVKENKQVTLVYSAKDESHNNALVLREYVK